jgi:hypothetical protein
MTPSTRATAPVANSDLEAPWSDAHARLGEAAQSGDVKALKKELARGGDPNRPDEKGVTAAMRAAANGQERCLDILGPLADLDARAKSNAGSLGFAGVVSGLGALHIGLRAAPIYCHGLIKRASAEQAREALAWLDARHCWIPPHERFMLIQRVSEAVAEEIKNVCGPTGSSQPAQQRL